MEISELIDLKYEILQKRLDNLYGDNTEDRAKLIEQQTEVEVKLAQAKKEKYGNS